MIELEEVKRELSSIRAIYLPDLVPNPIRTDQIRVPVFDLIGNRFICYAMDGSWYDADMVFDDEDWFIIKANEDGSYSILEEVI